MEKILQVVYNTATALTGRVIQNVTGYAFDNTDGVFRATPTDPVIPFVESLTIPGLYEFRDERVVWADGSYSVIIYEGIDVIAGGSMIIKGDAEIDNTALPNITLPTPPNPDLQVLYGNVRILNWNIPEGDIVELGLAHDGQQANGALLSTIKSKARVDVDGNFSFFVPKLTRVRLIITNHGLHEFTTNSLSAMDVIDYITS